MENTATHTTAFSLGRLRALGAALAVACALIGVAASSAGAAFGIASFDGEVTREPTGEPAIQAGSHPYLVRTVIGFNTEEPQPGLLSPDGSFKDIHTLLPPGLVGNPRAIPRCTMQQYFTFFAGTPLCPDDTAVGYARLELSGGFVVFAPVYNLVPEAGKPARFGFRIITANIFLNANVRTGGDYGLTVNIPDASQGIAVYGTELTLWGVPADPRHDGQRGSCMEEGGPSQLDCPVNTPLRPFLTTPTSCVGPVQTGLEVDSWEEPNNTLSASFVSHDQANNPIGADGCDQLEFEPSFSVHVDPPRAETPASVAVDVNLPQDETVGDLATAHLKKAVVTLPAGMSINPAAANGLGACSAAQIGIHDPSTPSCPNSSRIGSAEIVSPLLDDPLEGSIYLAKQGENPSGNLLTIYLVASADGVTLKLPGKIDTDPGSGQITTTFDQAPQLPFEDLHLRFFGGPNGALLTPPACGTYTAKATFTPWSGTAPVDGSDSFAVNAGPNGGACPNGAFAPKLSAGSANHTAGGFSPFVLNFSREDGTQLLTGIDAKLPPGLLAKLAGIPYCADAAIASISTAAGTGATQVASPNCPAASQVGTLSVGAGAGPNPFFVNTGKVYLAGPYKGAPYSLALVTPALAGPLDLGNVVVRAAIEVNPENAQVEVVSDPLPTILSGVPLDLRDVRVNVNRPQFTVNPTSCDPSSVDATISGSGGAAASVSSRFQVGSCASLGLTPKLSLSVKGGTRRAAYPELRAVLKAKPGQANLRRVSVTLPKSELLAQEHIRTVCTRVQFAANACPTGSIYGFAKAVSPLLDQPLEGPVYLRSSNHKLPDLVAALHGQIDIVLAGRVGSKGGRLFDTFELIPDAPVTKFVLAMKGGKKGLLRNTRNLCAATNRATVEIDGQNGKTADQRPRVKADCGRATGVASAG